MPCYDQSCTASDLVNIPSLVLSDTFNTWFDRTNQLIEVSNAINILDIGVGPTDGGLRIERGCSGSFYNGIAVLYVNPGAGIGIGTESFTNNYNKVIVDAARLQDYGGGTGVNPIGNDYYIISDTRDVRQGLDGTPKRVTARRMLPDTVVFGPSGDGTFTIQGNLHVVGNLDVAGVESFIDANDLRIEDKMIELAYGRYIELIVRGTGLTAGSFAAGMTAYYVDDTDGNNPDDTDLPIPGPNFATTIGTVFSWAIGETGVSGTVKISSFTVGGVNDFVPSGNLVITGGGYQGVLNVTGPIGIGDYFLPDDLLQPAGIVIKGSEGDKTFLWVCNAADGGGQNWNAFVSNQNLGVSGDGNWILSSKFASHGYIDPTVHNTFTYLGDLDSYTRYRVGSELVMEHCPTGDDSSGATFGMVYMGSTGPNVFPNVPVYDWVKYFNADQLDGAHASTSGAPFTIPILGEDGRLGSNFVNTDAIRTKFTVSGHSFSKGDIVRIDAAGSLTFAMANTVPTAEALGMVDSISGDNIDVVMKGLVTNLSGSRIDSLLPLATGNVYFLSATVPGGMISNPTYGVDINSGEVRKAMLLASGANSGYVLNYTGVVIEENAVDTVYTSTFAPVGSIQPFAGAVTRIPRDWVLCDGRKLNQNTFNDLYSVMAQSYYADGVKRSGVQDQILIDGDIRNLSINDGIVVEWQNLEGNTVIARGLVVSTDSETRSITINLPNEQPLFAALAANTPVRIRGRTDGIGNPIFLIPDLRRRTIFGASTGVGIPGSGNLVPSLSLGQAGGSNQIELNQNISAAVGESVWANTTSFVNSMPPHVAVNWIMRTRKGANATILSGHDHDSLYIRHSGPHTIAAGASNDLTITNRNNFRSNARVLSNGFDGPDTFQNNLFVSGSLSAGTSTLSSINVRVSAQIGTNVISAGAGQHVIYGRGDESILRVYPPLANYFPSIPAGSPNPDIALGALPVCGLTGAVELSPIQGGYSIRYHNYDLFDETNPKARNFASGKAVQLTIQTDSGQLGCVPMYRVAERMPTASERIRLPQGFVWVNSAAGASSGSWIKSGQELYRMGSVSTDSGVPIGTIVIWSGTTTNIPAGWVLCNGQSHLVNGNTITTPDLRSRFVVGATGGSINQYSVGRTGGAETVTLTVAQMPAHSHQIPFGPSPTNSQGEINNDGRTMYPQHPATTSITGGNEPHENRPPYYALAYIMKIVGQVGEPQIPVNPSPLPCDPCVAAAAATAAAEAVATKSSIVILDNQVQVLNLVNTLPTARQTLTLTEAATGIPSNAKYVIMTVSIRNRYQPYQVWAGKSQTVNTGHIIATTTSQGGGDDVASAAQFTLPIARVNGVATLYWNADANPPTDDNNWFRLYVAGYVT